MTCIDLWRTYGHEYQVSTDPAYDTKGVPRAKLDPWYFVIPCKFGTIWPFGGEMLAVNIDYHNKIAKKVSLIPGVKLRIDGDQEKTYLFTAEEFDLVAAIVKPKKRRRPMTQEEKTKASERLEAFKFRPGKPRDK